MENELKLNRYTDEEIGIIKDMYGGPNGAKNLKLLRKVFFPEYDYSSPIGRPVPDIRLMGLEEMAQMSPGDRELAMLSQIRLASHLERQLQMLFVMANEKEASELEKKEKAKKDSNK